MTVLQSLDGYYGRMAARGEAEPPGFSREKISFRVVLSAAGAPVSVVDLRTGTGKRLSPQLLQVPAGVKRTVAIMPNLLWDKTAYAFGRTAGAGNCDGRFVLTGYAVLDGATWSGLVGPDQQGFVGQGTGTPSPTIMHLGRLGTADGRVVRTGMSFTPYRAGGDEASSAEGSAAAC